MGECLFYPGTNMVKVAPPPHLAKGALHHHAAHIRQRIEATVLRRAPQLMVKVTGGGRRMAAIAVHFRYIAKARRLPFGDDRGVVREGKDALRDLAEQWRLDLHRWRETFADKLRGWGVEAEATRQATRGEQRRYATLWKMKAEQEGRLHMTHARSKSGDKTKVNRTQAMLAWAHITQALAGSDQPEDRKPAESIVRYVRQMPHFVELQRTRQHGQGAQRELPGRLPVHIDARTSARSGPEIQRKLGPVRTLA